MITLKNFYTKYDFLWLHDYGTPMTNAKISLVVSFMFVAMSFVIVSFMKVVIFIIVMEDNPMIPIQFFKYKLIIS